MENDLTNQYNTPLTPEEQSVFDLWAKAQPRDVQNDKYDYDIQGWQKANPGVNLNNGHLTDKFKKPNHPTFSDQSQYHGQNGNVGGSWAQLPDQSWTFTPGATNLKNFTTPEMQEYFQRVEPKNKLILPTSKYNLVPVSQPPEF